MIEYFLSSLLVSHFNRVGLRTMLITKPVA